MTTSYLQVSSSKIPCFQNEYCFQACWQSMVYIPTGSLTANFGPQYTTLNTYYGYCTCSIFNIYNAVTTANSAYGSSPGGNPFTSVQMFGYSTTSTVSLSWTAGTGQYANRSCAATYYVTGGPPVLGAMAYSSWGYWWAVVVSIIVFFIFCCSFMCFCGLCASVTSRFGRTQGTTIGRPPPIPSAQNVDNTIDFTSSTYSERPHHAPPPIPVGQYATSNLPEEGIPIATAVPIPIGGQYGGEPTAVAQPVNENDRQVTIV